MLVVKQPSHNAKVGVTAIYFQSPNFPPFALNWVRKETPWDEDKGKGRVQSICSSVIAEIEDLLKL